MFCTFPSDVLYIVLTTTTPHHPPPPIPSPVAEMNSSVDNDGANISSMTSDAGDDGRCQREDSTSSRDEVRRQQEDDDDVRRKQMMVDVMK